MKNKTFSNSTLRENLNRISIGRMDEGIGDDQSNFRDDRDIWYDVGSFSIKMIDGRQDQIYLYRDDVEIYNGGIDEFIELYHLIGKIK